MMLSLKANKITTAFCSLLGSVGMAIKEWRHAEKMGDPSMGAMTACGHAQAALAAMPPLHRSNTDGPRRHVLPKKASFKSKGSILSHVTSGTWEEDADIENPHDAEEARKSPRVGSAAKSTHLPSMLCLLFGRPSGTGMGEASSMRPWPGTKPRLKSPAPVHTKPVKGSSIQPVCIKLMEQPACLKATSGYVQERWLGLLLLSFQTIGVVYGGLPLQLNSAPHLVPDL